MNILAIERFLNKVRVLENGCWEWTGAKSAQGYGWFMNSGGKVVRSHRFSYQYFNGVIPLGLDIDHTCHNGDKGGRLLLVQAESQVNQIGGNTLCASIWRCHPKFLP